MDSVRYFNGVSLRRVGKPLRLSFSRLVKDVTPKKSLRPSSWTLDYEVPSQNPRNLGTGLL